MGSKQQALTNLLIQTQYDQRVSMAIQLAKTGECKPKDRTRQPACVFHQSHQIDT